jgi:hypothetical protein
MSSIWNTISKKNKKSENKTDIVKELSDEIKEIRRKNIDFQATNETDTYCVLVFSCAKDRNEFVLNVLNKKETFIDGYEFARRIGGSPVKPSVKLPEPLNK